MILCRRIDSPVGPLMLAAGDDGLRHIEFRENRHPADRSDWHGGDSPVLQDAEAQLCEYFAGKRRSVDLPLAPQGTPFRRRGWGALRRIPAGETRSYLAVAREVGCLSARAIGGANGANPIPILIPCHRVVAADGSLGGYSGGEGEATKRYLLDLERRALGDGPLFTASSTRAKRRTSTS